MPVILKYLLWGDRWPAIARHETHQPERHFAAPDVLLLVMDATALERDLELALELAQIGKPLVIALNRMDEARAKRLFINVRALSAKLGAPVVPTVAHMGIGLADLFSVVVRAAREHRAPTPQPPSPHIAAQLTAIAAIAAQPEVATAFNAPATLLVMQLAENDDYFFNELRCHFPDQFSALLDARDSASAILPRPLSDEIHADRHHRAALLVRGGHAPRRRRGACPRWQHWADELFLHPRWGFAGSLAIFALVLFFVFEVSAFLDSLTVARLIAWAEPWQPTDLTGVLARAVLDGFIGLAGIVIPYMIPLVVLLVFLEESGIMHRVAFVVDRGFHHLGLHGGVALPFLMGLGCNVPALAATAAVTHGRDRTVAALLITFLPCSARSAILLALGGKYLGGLGVFALFILAPIVVSLIGKLLKRRYPGNHARHDPGNSTLRAADPAPAAGQYLGTQSRHRHHRAAAPGRRQRRAGAARPLRRRCVDQPRADADHRLVAGPAGRARRADPVRHPAQGTVAADDLPGARHPGTRRRADHHADRHLPRLPDLLRSLRVRPSP